MNFMASKNEIKNHLMANFKIECIITTYDSTSNIVLIKGDYETAPILISNVCLNIKHIDLLVVEFLNDINNKENKQ